MPRISTLPIVGHTPLPANTTPSSPPTTTTAVPRTTTSSAAAPAAKPSGASRLATSGNTGGSSATGARKSKRCVAKTIDFEEAERKAREEEEMIRQLRQPEEDEEKEGEGKLKALEIGPKATPAAAGATVGQKKAGCAGPAPFPRFGLGLLLLHRLEG